MTSLHSAASTAAPHIVVRPEKPKDASSIETLCNAVFGPGARTRAAAALREGVPHRLDLSFVATVDSAIVGTCRLTPVLWGGEPILMLGPLGVSGAYKSIGIGKRLMRAALEAADAAGEHVVFLVGDLDYYNALGFRRVPAGTITLPRPADPLRILVREGQEDAAAGLRGPVTNYRV